MQQTSLQLPQCLAPACRRCRPWDPAGSSLWLTTCCISECVGLRSAQQLVGCGAGVGVGQVGIPVAPASAHASRHACSFGGFHAYAPSPRGHFNVCVHLLRRAFTTAAGLLPNLSTISSGGCLCRFLPCTASLSSRVGMCLPRTPSLGWLNAACYEGPETCMQFWGIGLFTSLCFGAVTAVRGFLNVCFGSGPGFKPKVAANGFSTCNMCRNPEIPG